MTGPILIVCLGNLCRSPFAERYLRLRLEAAGKPCEIFSRGLIASPGCRPPELAIQAAKDYGVDLQNHRAQRLLGPDIKRSELIFVMENDHRREIANLLPSAIGKVLLLSQAAPPPIGGKAIPDPMGKDAKAYRQSYRMIAQCLDAWIPRLGIA